MTSATSPPTRCQTELSHRFRALPGPEYTSGFRLKSCEHAGFHTKYCYLVLITEPCYCSVLFFCVWPLFSASLDYRCFMSAIVFILPVYWPRLAWHFWIVCSAFSVKTHGFRFQSTCPWLFITPLHQNQVSITNNHKWTIWLLQSLYTLHSQQAYLFLINMLKHNP